jgi:hypothetical protein
MMRFIFLPRWGQSDSGRREPREGGVVRFRRGAGLDPGQVTDVRGRRLGPGGLALGGGGLGGAALIVYLLITLPT